MTETVHSAELQAAPGREALHMFFRNKAAVFGVILLIGIIALALFGPVLIDEPSLSRTGLASPREEGGGLMGTDENGRDIFAFVAHGGMATLQVALVSVGLIVLIGVTIGALAGFYGGRIDAALVWFTEIFQVLPALLFAMVIVALFSPTSLTVSIAIGLALWPQIARLTRAEFLRLKNLEYVKAARAIGASDIRIMFRVILPNALPPLIVAASLVMGAAILFHAGLAFLGLSDPSEISWGRTIGTNRNNFPRVWWPVTFPGLAIFLTVLSFSLIGDGLQDAFNPKLRGR